MRLEMGLKENGLQYLSSYQMSCPHDYPDPVDRRAGRTPISD